MLFYFTLFLVFLYFKIARVHKKEERLSNVVVLQHSVVALSTFFIYSYGFNHSNLFSIAGFSFLFFIIAALMVATVQLGIFIDGKPIFGISLLFKLMPLLTFVIALFTFLLSL